jgi:PBSX family phage terminase large subunit
MKVEGFHDAQKEISKDTHRMRVVLCGRRFGKTTLAVYEMLGRALSKKGANICYIAPTIQQARDIAWQQLKELALPITVKSKEAPSLELEVSNKFGTSSIKLRGWESIETLRGQAFDFLVLDEVATYRNFWVGWHEVLRATLTDNQGDCLFIGTPKGFNHFYDLYNTKDEDYKSFNFTSYDNPFISREELDKIREEISEDRFAQEYLADFRKTEGLVYKEFERSRHVKEYSPIGNEEVIVSVDFGYTNPSAVLKAYKHGDRYHIAEEWYKTRMSTGQIVDAIKSFNPIKVYPDPAEPDRIQELNDAGLFVCSVSKDIEAGIDKVRELLKQGRLTISPQCVNLIYEFETYCYPDTKGERNPSETPIKKNDHALDSLRYLLFNEDRQDFSYSKHKTSY